MRMSQRFPRTRRDVGTDLTRAHALLIQAGLIRQVSPGIWTLLPDGWKVLQNVHAIIYDMMESVGVQNIQMPILQSRDLWEQSGRWKNYIDTKTMFTTSEYHYDAEYGLAPTAEEVVSFTAANDIESWRDLPVILHQIGPKFRDEIRPRLGLLRGREFYMSDAYSFDRDEEGMRASFEKMREMYPKIYAKLGLTKVKAVEADSGDIGGKGSVEYMALNEEVGEDLLIACDECSFGANTEVAAGDVGGTCHECKVGLFKELRGIEIGHVFQLQQVYSKSMNVTFRDEHDKEQHAWMGCYGIGTSRLVQAIVDQNYDDDGIIWPESVAPVDVHVIAVNVKDDVQREIGEKLYSACKEAGLRSMFDDRDAPAGMKFKDADLLGYPYRITAGRKAGEGIVEIRNRRSGETEEVAEAEVVKWLKGKLKK
jgi:prolyl-tRNA synthetase